MKCTSCGFGTGKGWRYCPACGSPQADRSFNIGDIFSRMRREMMQMSRGVERDMTVFDLSPFFRKMPGRGSGFSIHITSGTGMQPKVEVKTFGDIDRRQVEEQVAQQLGYRQPPTGGREPRVQPQRSAGLTLPKETEEPKVHVTPAGNRVMVDLEIPGVKSEKDIEVTELESSIEVKAIAGERGYFKILTKPEQFSLTSTRFEKEKLHLEFG